MFSGTRRRDFFPHLLEFEHRPSAYDPNRLTTKPTRSSVYIMKLKYSILSYDQFSGISIVVYKIYLFPLSYITILRS